MGIETAIFVSAIAAAGESVAEVSAARAKTQALDIQGKEIRLATEQKTLANYDAMEKVIAAQVAHMTTTGLAFSSPSFNAIQRDTYNTAAKDRSNIKLMGELAERNNEIEKENVQNTLFAQLFGNASKATSTGVTLYNNRQRSA
jgi:translation elongation factor P/translation initiation factor 5A